MKNNISRVGIGVMIFKNSKVLMHQRKGSHGSGEYSFPGGHLEYMETFEECARRETKEESGIEIKNIKFLLLANVKKYKPKHYMHITLIADWKSGEPQVLEPDKSVSWNWYSLNDLPRPQFEMCRISFEAYKDKKNYFDGL